MVETQIKEITRMIKLVRRKTKEYREKVQDQCSDNLTTFMSGAMLMFMMFMVMNGCDREAQEEHDEKVRKQAVSEVYEFLVR
tara:strand:- start:577 stop:822 length:246 start_codon:yes stop_codon:yes gene_type:complete